MPPWLTLIAAGICEVVWAVGLKSTAGFTRPRPTVVVVAAMLLSFLLLARAARVIHPPLAYSVWVGIGVLGSWAVSIVLFKDPFRPVQLLFVALIIGGIVGLKMSAAAPPMPAP